MTKIFIINGGQKFGHSGGRFNETISNETVSFFKNHSGFEIKTTNINDDYNPATEVEKFVWADVIIYHTPIWWFQLPHGFKKYIDGFLQKVKPKEFTKVTGDLRRIQALIMEQEGCFRAKNTC